MFTLCLAHLSEVDACYDLIEQGRAFQRRIAFQESQTFFCKTKDVFASLAPALWKRARGGRY